MPRTEVVKSPEKKSRDWFGYILTGVIGIVVTVAATWYQLYVTDRQVTAAEVERARAVRQSVISIVEEQALNGKRLDVERITRLIDQRRRDQSVSTPMPTADVVEQAEFNIMSSTYLSVERKEQIKPIFEAFYADIASKTFQAFPQGAANSALLNEMAKQIQDGKNAAALANLKRLAEVHQAELAQYIKRSKPSIFEVLEQFFAQPWKLAVIVAAYLALVQLMLVVLRRRRMLLRPPSRFEL